MSPQIMTKTIVRPTRESPSVRASDNYFGPQDGDVKINNIFAVSGFTPLRYYESFRHHYGTRPKRPHRGVLRALPCRRPKLGGGGIPVRFLATDALAEVVTTLFLPVAATPNRKTYHSPPSQPPRMRPGRLFPCA